MTKKVESYGEDANILMDEIHDALARGEWITKGYDPENGWAKWLVDAYEGSGAALSRRMDRSRVARMLLNFRDASGRGLGIVPIARVSGVAEATLRVLRKERHMMPAPERILRLDGFDSEAVSLNG